ncbi:Notch 2 N-Terminal-Like Protein C [Manis pentadactyla]|nr:Notch 2 N-Terminal-Like Protein C [Manis pentadactyla]
MTCLVWTAAAKALKGAMCRHDQHFSSENTEMSTSHPLLLPPLLITSSSIRVGHRKPPVQNAPRTDVPRCCGMAHKSMKKHTSSCKIAHKQGFKIPIFIERNEALMLLATYTVNQNVMIEELFDV